MSNEKYVIDSHALTKVDEVEVQCNAAHDPLIGRQALVNLEFISNRVTNLGEKYLQHECHR